MSASLLFPLGRLLRRYEVGKRSAVTLHRPTHTGSSVLGLLPASLGGSRLISRPERPHVLRDRVELHHDSSDLRKSRHARRNAPSRGRSADARRRATLSSACRLSAVSTNFSDAIDASAYVRSSSRASRTACSQPLSWDACSLLRSLLPLRSAVSTVSHSHLGYLPATPRLGRVHRLPKPVGAEQHKLVLRPDLPHSRNE